MKIFRGGPTLPRQRTDFGWQNRLGQGGAGWRGPESKTASSPWAYYRALFYNAILDFRSDTSYPPASCGKSEYRWGVSCGAWLGCWGWGKLFYSAPEALDDGLPGGHSKRSPSPAGRSGCPPGERRPRRERSPMPATRLASARERDYHTPATASEDSMSGCILWIT